MTTWTGGAAPGGRASHTRSPRMPRAGCPAICNANKSRPGDCRTACRTRPADVYPAMAMLEAADLHRLDAVAAFPEQRQLAVHRLPQRRRDRLPCAPQRLVGVPEGGGGERRLPAGAAVAGVVPGELRAGRPARRAHLHHQPHLLIAAQVEAADARRGSGRELAGCRRQCRAA